MIRFKLKMSSIARLLLGLLVFSLGQPLYAENQHLKAGASSASILPTVNGNHDYLSSLPDIGQAVDPYSPGIYVEAFDQGVIDIDNGKNDAAWVHDDIRVAALALQDKDSRVIIITADVYMITQSDADEIRKLARLKMPQKWQQASILFTSTHNHHGPGTMFSVNANWYQFMADQIVLSIVEAIDKLAPARIKTARADHRFGLNDVRDPVIIDPAVRIIYVENTLDQSAIATLVQWSSHVESSLGWAPPIELKDICNKRDWQTECTAEGRYITSDYPGEMRNLVHQALGGEVLYVVGAIGSQIGPGKAPVWQVDVKHPLGNGWQVPEGAQPIRGAENYLDKNFVKAEVIGQQLGRLVVQLKDQAQLIAEPKIQWRHQVFYSRLHQLGFRALLAQNKMAWQGQPLYLCEDKRKEKTCHSDQQQLLDDPVAGKIRAGEYIRSQVGYLSLGADTGMLFMPGEFPPEYFIGLPADFYTAPEKYYRSAKGQHAMSDYQLPGVLQSLIDDKFVMPVGLGNDELGYWVPVSDIRIPCAGDILAAPGTCKALYEAGIIEFPTELSGTQCKEIVDQGHAATELPEDIQQVLVASCYYGLMLGQSTGYSEGHYEETNSVGWDLMEDSWWAFKKLFSEK